MPRTSAHTRQKPIVTYPKFSKLDISHKKTFDYYALKFGHYSDFNFTSIYSWDTKSDTEVSKLNSNLIIKMPDYITGEDLCSVIGNSKIDDTLRVLLNNSKTLKLIPEVVVKAIKNKEDFKVTEDIDNHDYIFNISDLANLPGHKYKTIRNKISKFKRDFTDFEKLSVSTTSVVDIERFKCFHDVFYRWSKDKDLTEEEFGLEKTAIYRLVEHSKDFNILIVEFRLGGELIGFSINEILTPGYAIAHFEKAIKIHKYFNAYMVQQVAQMMENFGAKKVNWEQDLGLPGLRRSKSNYCPTEMLNKYQVSLNK